MLFKPELIVKIPTGEKGQTRRLFRNGDHFALLPLANGVSSVAVVDANGRVRWQVGRDYAACPGRGEFQVCRIRILAIFNYEQVGAISQEDARAEGFKNPAEFVDYFLRLNRKGKVTDLVWPLKFEPAMQPQSEQLVLFA